jgi:ligand-binding SRPBCC domain-containing protein
MRVHYFNSRQIIAAPILDVFEFFNRPENLEILTPPFLRSNMMTPRPVPMHTRSVIDCSLRIHGFPVHWRTLITDHDPPSRFVDVQLKGPYRLWHHQHLFRELEAGTEIQDLIHYVVPCRFLGNPVNRTYARRDIQTLFEYRRRKIYDIFKVASA